MKKKVLAALKAVKKFRKIFFVLAVAVILLIGLSMYLQPRLVVTDSTTFLSSMDAKKVKVVTVYVKKDEVSSYTALVRGKDEIFVLKTEASGEATKAIEGKILELKIPLQYSQVPEPFGWGNIGKILLIIALGGVILLALWLGFMMLMGPPPMDEGRPPGQGGDPFVGLPPGKKPRPKKKIKKTTFADVAGCDEAKTELQGIVDYLKGDKPLYEALGTKIPKGVLLNGPPGTGKTLLARAMAHEAGIPFIIMNGSEFIEMYVGVGASRVRDLFDQARANAPCVIFIDEIDSVGGKREGGGSGGAKEHQQTMDQLLAEMDGCSCDDGVIIMAATNRLDMLDPALLRPGRFDKKIFVGLPNRADREKILEIHTRDKPLTPEVNLADIAKMTTGFSGADLESLTNEAAKIVIREIKKHPRLLRILLPLLAKLNFLKKKGIKTKKPPIGIPHWAFVQAWDRVVTGGDERKNILSERDKRETAVHEAGHALVAHIRYSMEPNDTNPLYKVSIIPRGRALGMTYQLPEGDEDKYSLNKRSIYNNLIIFYGGWAAEKVVLGVTTSGVSNDLERATELVKSMVLRWGMSENLPPMHLAGSGGGAYSESRADRYSGATEHEINAEIRALISMGCKKAELMVRKNRKALDALVDALLEKETLDREECEKILTENIPPENLERDAYSTKKQEYLL